MVSGIKRASIKHHRCGFTLIELSIVLVIIGLIVGGVLAGQNLINAAAVRATIAQIEKYNSAVNAFRSKYDALPGDIKNWAQFGLAERTNGIEDGDGNGLIEACNNSTTLGSQGYGCETALFWRDLGDVHLIEGNFDSVYAGSSDTNNNLVVNPPTSLALYIPVAKLGNNNYVAVFTGGYPHQAGWSVAGSVGRNYFFISNMSSLGDDYGMAAAITPAQAYAIDAKMDDGQPLGGSVQSIGNSEPNHNLVPDTPAATDCSTSNTSYNLAPTYASQVLCSVSFQFQ